MCSKMQLRKGRLESVRARTQDKRSGWRGSLRWEKSGIVAATHDEMPEAREDPGRAPPSQKKTATMRVPTSPVRIELTSAKYTNLVPLKSSYLRFTICSQSIRHHCPSARSGFAGTIIWSVHCFAELCKDVSFG